MISIHLVEAVKVRSCRFRRRVLQTQRFSSVGFTRIEWMAHVLCKFRKSGLSLRVLRRLFCQRIEPGNNFSKRFFVAKLFRTAPYDRDCEQGTLRETTPAGFVNPFLPGLWR